MDVRLVCAALGMAVALAGCSKPQAGASDGKTFVAADQAAATAGKTDRDEQQAYSDATQGPVLDAQGNELDPELADAVRESVRSRQAEADESGGEEPVGEDPSGEGE